MVKTVTPLVRLAVKTAEHMPGWFSLPAPTGQRAHGLIYLQMTSSLGYDFLFGFGSSGC